MKNVLVAFLIGLLTFSFMVTDAQAKRFGGGKSFGMSRQMSGGSYAKAAPGAAAAAAKPAAAGGSKWLGPLAGFAAGSLLTSMFMGHGGGMFGGAGGGLFSWLILGALVYFGWRFIRSRLPSMNMNNSNANFQAQPITNTNINGPRFADTAFTPVTTNQPLNAANEDFDATNFLREAKSLFIRMQAAYDSKNLTDIRQFTNPQVFAEVQMQLQERGNEINQTDVVYIDAQLLDRTVDGQSHIASVLFSGLVREQADAEPTQIKEIWHFQKDVYSTNWIVAGIQQD